MGKKVSPRMVKNEKNKEVMIESLIGVFRPKVYIADTSSFKMLVQQLTGNGAPMPPLSSLSSCPTRPSEKAGSVADMVENGDHVLKMNSVNTFTDASVDSFLELQSEEHVRRMNQMVDAYRDLESWLLDVDA